MSQHRGDGREPPLHCRRMTAHAAGTEAGPGTAISALIRERLPDLARAWPEELAAEGRFTPSVPLPEAERFVEAVAAAVGRPPEPLAAPPRGHPAHRRGLAGPLDAVPPPPPPPPRVAPCL